MFILYANKNRLEVRKKEPVTSGSVNTCTARFEFSPDWDGLTRTVVFRAGTESRSVLLDKSNTCDVPWETLVRPGALLQAGVYGTQGEEVVLPTVWADLGTILSGATLGENTHQPTPNVYEQIMAAAQAAIDTANSIREDAESGTFTGPEGPQGEQGPKGDQGPQGPTGEKGADGIGVPPGGEADWVLAKKTSGDYDTYWTDTTAQTNKIWTAVEDIKAYLGYADKDIAGLCVDYQNKTFIRLAGAAGKSKGKDFDSFPMYGGRKRCTVRNDGTILAYYGDDGYNEDDVTETGDKVQVMVYQPAFWYKVVPLVLDRNTDSGIGYHIRKASYYISSIPKPGFKLHPAFYDKNGNPVDYILLSAYEGSMWDASPGKYINDNKDTDTVYENGDLLCSVSGVKPISGKLPTIGTKANFEKMAQSRGPGWHLNTIKAEAANQLLMMIELGTMNTQTAIGQGVVSITDDSTYNCSSLTGSTTGLGSGTGEASETINEIGGTQTSYTTSGKVSVSYRGVENPWGNIFKHTNGVNIWGDSRMDGGQVYIADDFDFSENKHDGNYQAAGFTIPNASGFISAMGYGKEEFDWVLIPSESGGAATSALPVGDYIYVTPGLDGYRAAPLGGYWNRGSNAGAFLLTCSAGAAVSTRYIGGRLLYVPTARGT